ncbi:glutathione S-transferase N-terminal domain-containing protein [Paraburkholderia dilworthii]|uniref:Glutathione S-transferase N-terminal domain-containing protein n=1 Tax=Paraburkholderia dilworthii TaxID=948106 RepID=A0ABW9DAE6_9BURK
MSQFGHEATFDTSANVVNNHRCADAERLRPLMRDWSDAVTTTEAVTLYGAAWSVYVRIVRLALEEKHVKYDLVEVDVFSKTGVPEDHFTRHPFSRVPAFEHGSFPLYDTNAIVRYIDDAFLGCKLQLTEPKARAKVNQIVGIMDAYA